MNFLKIFTQETLNTIGLIDLKNIEKLVDALKMLKKNRGRLFFIGIGGSAANASHAVNDFRKLCEIESYSITDNVSELTARINDEGWQTSFSNWLKISKLNKKDALFIFSVGGGSISKNISLNIVESIKYAKKINAKVFGVVGPNGGFTKLKGDLVIQINIQNKNLITPIAESVQAIIWHMIVSHPKLKINKTKW